MAVFFRNNCASGWASSRGRALSRLRDSCTALLAMLAVDAILAPFHPAGLPGFIPAAAAQQVVTISYTYDANGTRTSRSDGSRTDHYAFDSHRRLIGANAGSAAPRVSTFRQDADGFRAETVKPTSVHYQLRDRYNGSGVSQVVEDRSEAGAPVRSVTYGAERLSSSRTGVLEVFHGDALGSTRQLTSAQGLVLDNFSYEAFGTERGGMHASGNDFLFAGEKLDADLGWYDLRSRNYDVESGRFSSADAQFHLPNLPQALNSYAYVQNNPVNDLDPLGSMSLIELVVTVGILSTTAALPHSAVAASKCKLSVSARFAPGLRVGPIPPRGDEWTTKSVGVELNAAKSILKGRNIELHWGSVEPLGKEFLDALVDPQSIQADASADITLAFVHGVKGAAGEANAIPGNRAAIAIDALAGAAGTVVAHEIGHCLGFTHVPFDGEVMYPGAEGQINLNKLGKFFNHPQSIRAPGKCRGK